MESNLLTTIREESIHTHGTSGYDYGCRCDICRDAHAKKQLKYNTLVRQNMTNHGYKLSWAKKIKGRWVVAKATMKDDLK